MNIIRRKFINSKIVILAIFICITFILYRFVDLSMTNDFANNRYFEFHQNQMLGYTNNTIHDGLIHHSVGQETHLDLHFEDEFIIEKFYGDDKGSLFYLIILLASFFMIHLFVMQQFFLYVRRWLIKTNIILERYTLLVIDFVHRKDGKKRYYPSYVHS